MKRILSVFLMLLMLCSLGAAETLTDGTYTGSGAGLNGKITVEVTVDGGKITAVNVLEHQETPTVSDPAFETIPQAIIDAQSTEVDAAAGATFTSKGIMEAVANALSGEEEAEDAGIPFEQADILVLGGGMGGVVTATRAAQLGLNVLLLEQNASLGGSAMVAGGTLLGCGTRMQAEAGITDDPDLCFADFVRLGGAGTFNEELGREFSRISGEAVDWLDDLGADFGDRKPYFGVYQPLNIARNYSGKNGAKAFIAALTAELDKYIGKNAYVSLNTKVTGLLTDADGAVIGAKAVLADGTEKEFLAPATVVATGGYGGNKELLTTYNFTNVLTTSPTCVTGDGYFWLQELGAALTNMDFCTSYAGGIETNPDNFRDFGYFNTQTGCLWINTAGERTIDEMGADSHDRSETWLRNDQNIVYTVFTREMLDPEKKIFSTGAWGSVTEEFEPYMASLVEKGIGWQADSIEELADMMGVPKDAFVATIQAYNDGCASGNDPFGRKDREIPMENGPFYAVKTIPYVMITSGGPMMTKDCEVVNTDGLVIPGVYMAGEIVGMANVGGLNSIGGMGHGNCLIWGKKAAEVIAERAGK